jgi:hypothetical protein
MAALPQHTGLYQFSEYVVTRLRVKVPESLNLGPRQPQARTLPELSPDKLEVFAQ